VVQIEPGGWIDAAERIGLGGALLLILALGLATAFVTRGPGLINALNGVLDTILKHQRKKKWIDAKIAEKQQNLKRAIETAQRKGKSGERK
jgi:hypothetical protein